MSPSTSSQVEAAERMLRAACERARGAGLELIYGGPPVEYGPDGDVAGVSLLNALRPVGHPIGSFSGLAVAVADAIGVSACVAREISYGWDCAPPGYLEEWCDLGWRLHVEFRPRPSDQ